VLWCPKLKTLVLKEVISVEADKVEEDPDEETKKKGAAQTTKGKEIPRYLRRSGRQVESGDLATIWRGSQRF
jgi:hypothetical protein